MNPFTELLAIIDDWTDAPGNTILSKRGDTDVWINVDRATRLLLEITDFLNDRHDAFPEATQLITELWKFLVHPDSLWRDPANRQNGLPEGWKGMMQALAAVWDKESTPITALTSAQLESLRGTLEEMRVLVGEIPELSAEERDYLLDLIRKCQRLLDIENPDFTQARSACMETIGAAAVACAAHRSEKSSSLFFQALKLGGYWFSAFTSSALANITSDTALKMLTSH